MADSILDPSQYANLFRSAVSDTGASASSSGGSLTAAEQAGMAPVYRGKDGPKQLMASPFSYITSVGVANPAFSRADKVSTLADSSNEWYTWSDAQRHQWGEYLVSIGYLDKEDVNNYSKLQDAWNAAVQTSSDFYAKGNKKVTPKQAINLLAGNDSSGKTAQSRQNAFTGTKRQTQQQVDITDPETAKGLVNQTLAKYLGRYANQDELNTMIAALNTAQQQNPTTTTTDTTYQNGEAVSSSSSTTGGIDPNQLLEDKAMAMPDYGAYQAATLYASALEQALGTVGGN